MEEKAEPPHLRGHFSARTRRDLRPRLSESRFLMKYRCTDNKKESFVPFFRKKGTPKTAKRRWAYAPSLGTHPRIDLTANPCSLTLALWYLTDRACRGTAVPVRIPRNGVWAKSISQSRDCVPDCPKKRKALQKPPSDEGGGFAARRRRRERGEKRLFLSPSLLLAQKPAPSSEGALVHTPNFAEHL